MLKLTKREKCLWGIMALMIFVLSLNFIDTDLYYMIANGRAILESGSVPKINPVIIEPDCGIIIQNWLYCVLVAFIDDHFHTGGLWLLQVFFLSLMLIIMFKFFDFKHSKHKTVIGIFSIISLIVFGYWNLRPEMLTFILVMIEILCLEKYRDEDKDLYLWIIPILVLIQINCHASYWIMHYIVILPYIVKMPKWAKIEHSKTFTKEQKKDLLFPVCVMTLLLHVNPYGFDGIMYVFTSLSSQIVRMLDITEQVSPTLASYYGVLVLLTLIFFIYLYVKKSIDSISAFMFLGFWVLMFMAVKWVAFLAIGLMYLFRNYYEYFNEAEIIENKIQRLKKIDIGFLLGAVCLLCVGFLFTGCGNFLDFKTDNYLKNGTDMFSGFNGFNEFCDYLDENDQDAVVFAAFQKGNYFEYRGYKTVYDARPEIYVKEITGGAEPIKNALVLKYGYNYFDYIIDESNNSLESFEDYLVSYEDYGNYIDATKADYFVVAVDDDVLRLYFESKPDEFELIMSSKYHQFWHKI